MKIKNAIRDLKSDLPRLKAHLKESREGLRELRAELFSDVEDLETQLYVAKIQAQDALKEEKAWATGITRTYLKTHATALLKGLGADLKIAAYYAWCLPFSLVLWAAFLLAGVAVTLATFSLRQGGETVERLIDAL